MCKTVSFCLNDKGDIFYFNKEKREKLAKEHLEGEEPDSHSTIAHYFNINVDKVDKFEIDFHKMKVVVDQINTDRGDENLAKLQRFVNRKDKSFWIDLIQASHVVWLDWNIPEWMTDNWKLTLPNAEYIYFSNNQLTSLKAENAETINCSNNRLTLKADKAKEVYCFNNQLMKRLSLLDVRTTNSPR